MILESCKGIGTVLGVRVCFCPSYWIWGYPSNSWHIDYGTDCSKQMVLEIESCSSRENTQEQECAHPTLLLPTPSDFQRAPGTCHVLGRQVPRRGVRDQLPGSSAARLERLGEPQVTPWGWGPDTYPFWTRLRLHFQLRRTTHLEPSWPPHLVS